MPFIMFAFSRTRAAMRLAVLVPFTFLPLLGTISPSTAENLLKWEAVNPQVSVGKAVRLEIRLTGTRSTIDPSAIKVESARLDMGPDGMPTMAAPLRAIPTPGPSMLAFEAELAMAGRWALSITANVTGESIPVKGVVIFTSAEKRSSSTPPAQANQDRKPIYYRNPMGLADVSPVPKKDSMGMDYIPVYADELADKAGTIRVSVEKIQRAGVRTEAVARRIIKRPIRAIGTVAADESRIAMLTTKFSGFIEELYVPAVGAIVRAGQPIAKVWIESSEIIVKQSDLLTALRGGPAAAREIDRAERNLRLFGVPEQMIRQLRKTGEPSRSVVLTATTDGTVIAKPAVVGMRFATGESLIKTVDLSTIWVMTQIAERDLAAISVGQIAKVVLSAFPDQALTGKISFIYPELNMATRTATLRIEMPNPNGQMLLGLYAEVAIDAELTREPVVAIPESAIIDSGTRKVALIAKGDGVFEPRLLTLGRRGDGYVELTNGIADGEQIVVTGNFLIDAESNLRAALTAFTAPKAQP